MATRAFPSNGKPELNAQEQLRLKGIEAWGVFKEHKAIKRSMRDFQACLERMGDNQAQGVIRLYDAIKKIDCYTLGIISSTVEKGSCITAAELARIHGVTRQRIHYKLKESWKKYPLLRPFLVLGLLKARKGKMDAEEAAAWDIPA